jgi:iron complex outermembrane receptor protein
MFELRSALCTLLAGSSALALAMPAAAQSADAAPSVAAEADIIVTGSRTITNGNNSPTPVTVVTTESLQNVRPTSLTDSLNVLPVFSGSRGLASNPSATGTTGGGNGTAAQLNLRNIGAQRNLVLMDGRRVPPTSFTNIVDADVIPQLLIKRVDLVTGGVSAVYGSDAISGVVNFITDTAFNGLKGQAQAGISSRGDDATHELGFAWGTKIGDRSHFEFSYEYRDDAGIGRRSDREWFNRTVTAGNGTTTPYFALANATLPGQPFGGKVNCGTTCAINGQYFATNGVLAPFANGTTYAGTTTQSGGAGGYYDTALKASLLMHQAFGRFDTDLSDNVHAFALVGFNFKRNRFAAEDALLSSVTLSKANPLLNPTYAALIPGATFTLGEMLAQNTRLDVRADSRQVMAAAGLNGKFGGADWSVDYTHGDSRLTSVLGNNLNNQKLSAALDVVSGINGPTCYAATQAATATAYANCQPLNLFGPSAASPAALRYIFDTTTSVSSTKQDDVNASIAGAPFSTWAGPVAMALSGEYRSQNFTQTSDGTPSMFADCTNLRYNCVTASASAAGTQLLLNTFAPTPKISQTVWEVAVEATAPLLKDVPFAANLDVTGAARYTKYNTVGGYTTWKAGFNWALNDDLRFRGTISRDIRAPTLYDLFGPTTVSFSNYTDTKPTPAVSAFLPQYNQSNPNLKPEIGHTKTIGMVYKPHYLPGLSFAVDYYDINITNAIIAIQGTAAQIQSGCNNAGVQAYCDLIVRNSSGSVVNYIQKSINLAQIRTSGVDFEVNYQGQLFGRALSLRGLAAYQPHIRYIQPSVPTIDQGGVAFGALGLTASPSWRLTGTLSYKLTDAVRIDLMERWRNRLLISGDPTVAFAPGSESMRPYGQTSVNLSVTVAPRFEFFLNVQNLFDAAPPAGNLTATAGTPGQRNGFASTDDVVGRYFVAGVKIKM